MFPFIFCLLFVLLVLLSILPYKCPNAVHLAQPPHVWQGATLTTIVAASTVVDVASIVLLVLLSFLHYKCPDAVHLAQPPHVWQGTTLTTIVAASTVVDVASMEVVDMDLWEPFRSFLLTKEVR